MKNIYYITKVNPILNIKLPSCVEILPLIELKSIFLPNLKELFLESGILIFTSKNAIYALNDNLQLPQNSDLLGLWDKKENFVLANGCVRALESLGKVAHFVAKEPYGDIFAQELVEFFKDSCTNKKPLFIRAKKIASKIPEIFKSNNIALNEAILYENQTIILKNPPQIKSDSIVFFSAPSHIRAFLKNYSWNPTNIAFCIGETSKECALKLLGENAKILQSSKADSSVAFKEMLEL